jgi:hypothetical protein
MRALKVALVAVTSAVFLIAAVIVAIVVLTTPTLPRPQLSQGGTFRVFASNADYAWYEIGIGDTSSVRREIAVRYIPTRDYLLGIVFQAESSAACENAATAYGVVDIEVENTSNNVSDHRLVSKWKSMFLPISPPSFPIRKENCTLYAQEGGSFHLSKFNRYRIAVAITGGRQQFLPAARLVLDGQG